MVLLPAGTRQKIRLSPTGNTLDGKKESGDLITPVKNNWIAENKIFPMGSLLTDENIPTPNGTRLFKTVGFALLDLFAAKLVYEKHNAQ